MPADARVLQVSYPPGEPHAYVAVQVEGDAVTTYFVMPQTELYLDGQRTSAHQLARHLADHRAAVLLTSAPDYRPHLCRAEFHTL